MSDVLVDYLIVGGGAGGGDNQGGGGGGGGVVSGTTRLVSNQIVTVGSSGIGVPYGVSLNNASLGGPSSLGSIVAPGGGHGGGWGGAGRDGGSGGGAMSGAGTFVGIGISGVGYNGGSGRNAGAGKQHGGGGGGAGGVGQNASSSPEAGGNGGSGVASSITGSLQWYGAGGGGGSDTGTPGSGGYGGGGIGGTSGTSGGNATYYGGGGGGGSNGGSGKGGSGYQGIVIVRYSTDNYINGSGGSVSYDGGYTIRTFTSNDTFTLPIPAIGIPSGLAVTDSNGRSITLEWQDAPYPSIQTNIYKNTSDSSSGASLAGAVSSGSQIFIAGGLQPLTTYYFWAKSMDSDGNLSSFSEGASGTTTALAEGPSAFIANIVTFGGG